MFKAAVAAALLQSASACGLLKAVFQYAEEVTCQQTALTNNGNDFNSCDYYKAATNCHCDNKCKDEANKPVAPEGCEVVECKKGCFPATATVELEDGSKKEMSELTIGDKVHVGNRQFSDVYYFSTLLDEATDRFYSISTNATADDLVLTGGHYLYANGQLTMAKDVQVGNMLVSDNGPAKVESVSRVKASGLYNPHTMTGDIVVDGILTSTYTDAVNPTLAHALLFPIRQLYSAGISDYSASLAKYTKQLPSWILDNI